MNIAARIGGCSTTANSTTATHITFSEHVLAFAVWDPGHFSMQFQMDKLCTLVLLADM